MVNKKLIEVALPLETINKESSREKNIKKGHPSTLHYWWSRKPLATCRAVLFASIVDDPSCYISDINQIKIERKRLFSIIEDLVKWENVNNEKILMKARLEIALSVARANHLNPPSSTNNDEVNQFITEFVPPFFDPFCGGGSIPLEARRLGLYSNGGDLNPVAVLISKGLVEIPPIFSNIEPINPERKKQKEILKGRWQGTLGLANDLRYYIKRVGEKAEKSAAQLYNDLNKKDGTSDSIIAWLWARTVRCPNPACRKIMPLLPSFWLSKNPKRNVWLDAEINEDISFHIKKGIPSETELKRINYGTSFINDKGKKVKATFICPFCGNGIAKGDYINTEANEGRMDFIPLAIVIKGEKGRDYIPFNREHGNRIILETEKYIQINNLESELPNEPCRGTFASNAQGRAYGFKTFSNYFFRRQLVVLTIFNKTMKDIRKEIYDDAINAGMVQESRGFNEGGRGALAYTDVISTYLALAFNRLLNRSSSICVWNTAREEIENTFGRQGMQISWNFAEVNPFSNSSGGWYGSLEWIPNVIENLPPDGKGNIYQLDAADSSLNIKYPIISTDPPYYDNVSYSDLSDYFYIWLRKNIGDIYPDLFSTVLTPKTQEIVVNQHRFNGNLDDAEEHFQTGLAKAFQQIIRNANHSYPVTIYYAFKQTEEELDEVEGIPAISSTGWETMLSSLLSAGFQITGTWPMRTESTKGLKTGNNVLASSILLVCRPRQKNSPMATRREIISSLRRDLPHALKQLQEENISPVDLAQAAIGPGIGIFSGYSKVLESDGSEMTVRTALQLINQELEAYLKKEEGEMDRDTQFLINWFEQFGIGDGPFGSAELLSKAKNTSVSGLVKSGTIVSANGVVSIISRDKYPTDWNPTLDTRLTLWECTQHLIKRLQDNGEKSVAELIGRLGVGKSEDAKNLAYRLYIICERKGWTSESRSYNDLVAAWPDIIKNVSNSMGCGPQKTFDIE